MICWMVHRCVAATRIICPTSVLLYVEKPRPVLSAVPTGRRLQKKIRFKKKQNKIWGSSENNGGHRTRLRLNSNQIIIRRLRKECYRCSSTLQKYFIVLFCFFVSSFIRTWFNETKLYFPKTLWREAIVLVSRVAFPLYNPTYDDYIADNIKSRVGWRRRIVRLLLSCWYIPLLPTGIRSIAL